MSILERYIFRRVALLFFLTLGALVGTFVLTQALDQLDIVTAQGQTLWILFIIIMMAMPNIIQLIAPIAYLIAMVVTLIAMNSDSEMAVMSAAGAGRGTLIRPMAYFAIILMIVLTFSNHILAPASLAALRGLITQVRADIIASLVQDGAFRTVEDGLTIHIKERLGDGSFSGIFVSDDRNSAESVHYTAKRGILLENANGAFLIMQDGDLVRDNRGGGSLDVVEFETYAFDLSRFAGSDLNAFYRPHERTTAYLLDPSPDDTFITDNPERAAAELHNRITAPLYPLAFALIAMAFLGRPRTSRQDSGLAILVVVILCVGIRGLSFAAFAAAESSSAFVPALYALPVAGILLGAILIFSGARLGMPEFLTNLIARLLPQNRPDDEDNHPYPPRAMQG